MTEITVYIPDEGLNEAGEILKRNITAYGGGEAYLRGKLYEKIAPNLQSVMSNSASGAAFGLPLLNKQPAAVQK